MQIWNIGSSQCEFELDEDDPDMMSFDYLTRDDQLHVITGHINNSVRVRDRQERTRTLALNYPYEIVMNKYCIYSTCFVDTDLGVAESRWF
jgi:hypothetical protein